MCLLIIMMEVLTPIHLRYFIHTPGLFPQLFYPNLHDPLSPVPPNLDLTLLPPSTFGGGGKTTIATHLSSSSLNCGAKIEKFFLMARPVPCAHLNQWLMVVRTWVQIPYTICVCPLSTTQIDHFPPLTSHLPSIAFQRRRQVGRMTLAVW